MLFGEKTVRRFTTFALAFLVLMGGIFTLFEVLSSPVSAVVGTNDSINFQGRLFNTQGAVVPDGFYNIQFKIYQDGTGTAAGNPGGTLKWTESFLNTSSQGVQVKNGYMSVELGSVNPFGTQVDWNQSVLWLSMNIGSTNASCASFSACTPDGEMVPMKRLSSSVYAMNANRLGGLTSAGFIQNQNVSPQTATNFSIDGTGTAAALQGTTSVSTPALRAVTDSTTGINIQNAAGTTTVMTIDTSSAGGRVKIGGSGGAPTATLQVSGSFTSSSGTINLNASTNNAVNIGTGTNNQLISIGGSANATTLGSNTLTVGSATAPTNISKATQTSTNTAGDTLTISGATGNGTGQGGSVTVQGGNGGASNANGGNLTLSGGTATGTGANGLVVITTPTFQTSASDANCYTSGALVAASCTISAASVNNSSAVIVGFSTAGRTAILPAPGIATAGRIVYVTAANTSNDFTLSVNGGGTGNQIAMRQNTTATMIWNGTAWTAAGASSSTTLQSAYDNTLQSAGGAELVVSKTGSTNGLTIRESSVAPVNGTLLSVQSSSAASLLSVNSNVTEYASNAGAETTGGTDTTFPANTWTAISTSPTTTVSRNAAAGDYIATGQGSVSVVTGAAANGGIKNQLVNSAGAATALTANTTYNVSFAARLLSGTFTDMNVYYSVNGTTASVPCTLSATAVTSVWSKVNCSFTTPASGITSANGILIRQTTATARTFYVDNISVTIAADYNFATDGGVDNAGSFAANWSYSSGTGTGTVTQNLADGYTASSSAQVQITAGAANAGGRNKLSSNPLPGTLYRLSVYAKANSTFNDFKIRYSRDGGTNFADCVDYNTQAVSTTAWTKITCYVKTDGTAATNPYVYFAETSSAVRTFSVDSFTMSLRDSSTPNVQIGGGVNGGPTTLLTLDKGASAPIAGDNDALLGSMYYDTTLGKLQCYEADGWGACGSSPDNIITISPEYTNAVFHGPSGGTAGIGTMTSDICSDFLNFNDGTSGSDTICGANETYNFYRWTSPQTTNQTYGIFVTYQLPSTFKSFASGQTYIMGRTDNGPSGGAAAISYKVYRSAPSGLSPCGATVPIASGTSSAWASATATGTADPSTCGFAPGDKIVFEIDMTTNKDAKAYAGNLGFTFSNK